MLMRILHDVKEFTSGRSDLMVRVRRSSDGISGMIWITGVYASVVEVEVREFYTREYHRTQAIAGTQQHALIFRRTERTNVPITGLFAQTSKSFEAELFFRIEPMVEIPILKYRASFQLEYYVEPTIDWELVAAAAAGTA